MTTEPAAQPAVFASGVTKTFGPNMALRNVDVELAWGQSLALLGHNGAGKSTLLRILATLTQPDAGTVHVAGYDGRQRPAQVRAAIGFLGHQTFLYKELSPRENLRFYAQLYRVSDGEGRITRLLEEVGATQWQDRRVGALSNGMQKRVALARALLHRPRLLVLDEPETGLDQQGQALLAHVIGEAVGSGASVVMTTHNAEWGLRVAQQAAVLKEGRIALRGASNTIEVAAIQRLLDQERG